MNSYDHQVHIDLARSKLVIYRLDENGVKTLYTEVDLPSGSLLEDEASFRDFAQKLGENLLVDSPQARKHFDI